MSALQVPCDVFAATIVNSPELARSLNFITMTEDFRKDELMTILESVSDGVIKLDRDANYVALNRAASEIFRQLGRDPAQVIGQSLWEVFPETKGTIVESELNRVFKEGLPTKYDFYLPPARRWYETSAYPSKEGVILVFRDITQSKVNPPPDNEVE